MIKRLVTHKHAPLLLALLGMLLALPSVWTGWQQDDLTLRFFLLDYRDLEGKTTSPFDIFAFLNGDPQRTRKMMDIGLLPWWTWEDIRLSFWRPLSGVSHWVDYVLWPDSAALMHLQNLFWYGALILVAAVLYRRFLGMPWVVGLATLLFAIDDAHGLPAGWISNRNALISALFGMLALLVHERWRRGNWKPGAFLGPALLLVGLLSGEFALGVIGYLLAFQVFLDSGSFRQRLLTFLPYAFMAGLWLVFYNMSGYGTEGSAFYVNPMSEPLAFAKAFIRRAPLLLADQLALPPSSIVLFLPSGVVSVFWVWALALLAILLIVSTPLIRRDRMARFWALGMILSLPPVCATMPHSRLLLLVGLGGMGLVAQWFVAFKERASWLPNAPAWQSLARIVLITGFVAHMIVAPILLPLNAVSPASAEPFIQQAVHNAPVGPELPGQDLVIVNPPNVYYAHFFSTVRAINNAPVPRHLRVLAPGSAQLYIARPDERTLAIRPEGGFLAFPFDNVVRSDAYPLRLHDQISLTNMTVEITALTEDGRPAEARFRFSRSLESESFKWLQWKDGKYIHFDLPPAGEGIVLSAQQMF